MTTDETPVALTEIKKRKTAITPATGFSLKDLSQTVSARWVLTPAITLMWTNPNAFATATTQFSTSLGERQATGGGRAALTSELKALDTLINKSQDYIKVYLKDKFDKDSFTSYLPQFGINMQGKKWAFPADRNSRHAALQLNVKAFADHGLSDKKFGLAFWQDILTRYDAALKQSVTTDSSVANLVSAKNEHRKQIQKTLNALIHIRKATTPIPIPAYCGSGDFRRRNINAQSCNASGNDDFVRSGNGVCDFCQPISGFSCILVKKINDNY